MLAPKITNVAIYSLDFHVQSSFYPLEWRDQEVHWRRVVNAVKDNQCETLKGVKGKEDDPRLHSNDLFLL
jgi:hypothetical protein